MPVITRSMDKKDNSSNKTSEVNSLSDVLPRRKCTYNENKKEPEKVDLLKTPIINLLKDCVPITDEDDIDYIQKKPKKTSRGP